MRKLFLAACALIAPFSAFGDVLFDQSPPDPNGYFSDGISTNGTQGVSQAVADNFTLAADSTVTKITFWGSSTNDTSADLDNFLSWDIDIYDTSFNALSTANVLKATLNPTATGGVNVLGGNEYQFTFDTNIALSAGSYFLHVGSVNADPLADVFVWSVASGDGELGVNRMDGNGWIDLTGETFDTSFRIEGTPAPEPASMAALGLGALAMIRRRRNRR